MKKACAVAISLLCATGWAGIAFAGNIEAPGSPPSGSGMYTLQNLYDYLTVGTTLAVQNGLEEPSSSPGSTMKSTKQIGDDIKALFDQCTGTAADMAQGKTFFCTRPGSWGVQTGTALMIPTPTPSATPWMLNPTSCNAIAGWHWYNNACWSDTIADSVPWNKSVNGQNGCTGDNCTASTGSYTCNASGTLASRMAAATAGRWSEICTVINGVSLAGKDGATGKSYISALAIADCIDGARDIGPAITGDSWETRNATLKAWSTASGHSALPAVDHDGSNNQYEAACTASGDAHWYENTSSLAPDINWCWAAACGYSDGGRWDQSAPEVGYYSCSMKDGDYTSFSNTQQSFRAVVRP